MAPARQGPHERPGPYLSRQHHQGLRRPSRLRGMCAQGSHRGNRQEWGHNATGLVYKFHVELPQPQILFFKNVHRHLVHPPWFHPLPARVERPVAVGWRRPLEGANSNWFFLKCRNLCSSDDEGHPPLWLAHLKRLRGLVGHRSGRAPSRREGEGIELQVLKTFFP